MRGEGCPVTIGRHGNRLHRLTTPCISPMAAVRVCERNCILAEWAEGGRKGGRRWRHPEFRWDKCGGTETGLETRERTVTPAQNLCLMIIAYPRIRVSEGSPMEFSLPRAFIKNIKASSNPGISLALGALDAYARKSPLGRSELFVVACARVRVTSLLATRITVFFVSEDHFVVRSHMKKQKNEKKERKKRKERNFLEFYNLCKAECTCVDTYVRQCANARQWG